MELIIHTSRMISVSSADRSQTVRDHCVIEVFGGDGVLSITSLFSCGIGVFLIGLSRMSSFFSLTFYQIVTGF